MDLLAPPWLLPADEDYVEKWRTWFAGLSKAEQTRYHDLFPPPPNDPYFYDVDVPGDEPLFMMSPSGWPIRFWRPGGEPKYTKATLPVGLRADDFIFFWKPNPGEVGPCSLGQWQPSPFFEHAEHNCAEQYMMATKARMFGDKQARDAVLESDDPKEMREFGRRVFPFIPEIWDRAKHSVVLAANYAKFTQNPELREYLLSTAPKVLVEAAPRDVVWGIGLGEANPKALDPAMWRGRNMLGFALMEVRDAIAAVYANYDLVREQVEAG